MCFYSTLFVKLTTQVIYRDLSSKQKIYPNIYRIQIPVVAGLRHFSSHQSLALTDRPAQSSLVLSQTCPEGLAEVVPCEAVSHCGYPYRYSTVVSALQPSKQKYMFHLHGTLKPLDGQKFQEISSFDKLSKQVLELQNNTRKE